jgi:hypothetical protein
MDRAQLADLLRTRREALQPEDVGLPRGSRRRTGGLRREEVAAMSGVSTDYCRIEQQRGAIPSEQVLSAIAAALRMTLDERDHLFRLAGHAVPRRLVDSDDINPGMMRILDRLKDTPADYHKHGVVITGHLRAAYTRDGAGSRAAALVDALLGSSSEFTELWREHAVVGQRFEPKRILHPRLGLIDVQCQTLIDPDQSQSLIVYTAAPGTESFEKLQRLSRTEDDVEHPISSSPRRSERLPRSTATRRPDG